MFRRFASKISSLAPLLARARNFAHTVKPLFVSQSLYKPFTASFNLPNAKSYATGTDESVHELKKAEEWENYASKISNEKPVIVEFFAK